tara:strand:+ start:31538 stop:32011 length:474 start_codon:yes stop_codon:yes gene_type:complete
MEKEKPMKTLIVAILGLALLAGCSTTPRQIEISAKPIEKPKLVLPPADELRLKDLTWVVINEENAQEVWDKLKKDRKDPVLIGLTDDGYEILAMNISDIMKLLQQQKAIIAAYKAYYEESEQALEDANSQIKGAKQEVDKQNNIPEESVLDKINPFK